jgi:hypothetical protein
MNPGAVEKKKKYFITMSSASSKFKTQKHRMLEGKAP